MQLQSHLTLRAKNDKSDRKENVTGGCCEFLVWRLSTVVTFIPFVLLADTLFLTCHVYVLCLTQKHLTNKLWFMTPLKGVIWGFCWKKLGVSWLSNHAGTIQLWSFASSSELTPKGSDFSTCGERNRWQNTFATPFILLLLHIISHQMSLCEMTKWTAIITDSPDRGMGVH